MSLKTEAIPTSNAECINIDECERRFNAFLRRELDASAQDVDDAHLAAFPLPIAHAAAPIDMSAATLSILRRASDGSSIDESGSQLALAANGASTSEELGGRFLEQLQRIDGPMRLLT